MQRKFFIIIFVIFGLISFYYFWSKINYPKHLEIKYNLVNHPEFIPSSKTVKLSSSWFDNLVADFYWLWAIQYIWSNAISSDYKKYLYEMLNLITDVNPYFTYPYEIGELLLPDYNERYEKLTKDERDKNIKQSELLWLKWIKNTCDVGKIKLIEKEVDLKKLWTEERYANPCINPNIPYYLAYIYYWNLFDSKKSSDYYKVTSANLDAVKWARTMAAIMQGKTWDRQKSIMMFLSLAESIWNEKSKSCNEFSKELWNVILAVYQNNQRITWDFISQVEKYRKEIVTKLWEEWVDWWRADADAFCSNYLNKAVREINLGYLEQADKEYFAKEKKHATDTKELFDNRYIDYFPRDFQKDIENEIIYYYNKDISNWDYKMWKY
ncbi:MAG: hypothetical protein ACD_4C00337G0010 [uncultured bacterium (gcode 4)]|uniref:Uncharacterized protein n=1 Tax=uncultured bacterium (gcode 4) TaxID=1234023 RepID=K2FWQ6_9BACT|nr:MAG: hypothetical protein ACD_4C00337G0010 [uncultured bacterium (gcode 4)]